ncbi:hypothetical protein LUZ62_083628 [Rhynchospora pubera]|uniref:Chromatin structure-remodeling complex protein BSH n=1 Tax=Rhynchospora pubera TaxID=906938 RepID=A0AAV8C133_9POAL|nr:hypothetical protein LUZ62_083628 [Rhynchospora pubera]
MKSSSLAGAIGASSRERERASASASASVSSIKFRMPTKEKEKESLIPIHLDLDLDAHRYKDAFTWNLHDPDSLVLSFAKRTVKDLKLPPTFVSHISQSIQHQLAEFRSFGGQDMFIHEKIVPLKLDLRVNNTVVRDTFLWDISNFESDPEEFAVTLCNDLDVADPEVAPAIAVAIREQLYEIATQSVSAVKEAKLGKKGRRGYELSKGGNNALDVSRYFGSKGSGVIRKRKDWYMNGPTVDVLTNEEVGTLEELNSRFRRKLDEKEDSFLQG